MSVRYWRRREEEGGMVCTGEVLVYTVKDCLINIYYNNMVSSKFKCS